MTEYDPFEVADTDPLTDEEAEALAEQISEAADRAALLTEQDIRRKIASACRYGPVETGRAYRLLTDGERHLVALAIDGTDIEAIVKQAEQAAAKKRADAAAAQLKK